MKQYRKRHQRVPLALFVVGAVLLLLAGCRVALPVPEPVPPTPTSPTSATVSPTPPVGGTIPQAAGQSAAAEQVGQIVRQALLQQLQINADQVAVMAVEPREFPDACLGVALADELCAQVITPGYVVTLTANGEEYRYHSNANASSIRLAAAPTEANNPGAATAYQPGDPAQCQSLRDDVAQVLGVAATLVAEPAAFQSLVEELGGASCLITATGTGENFASFVEVADGLVQLLEGQGWTRDPFYVADGPSSTIMGLRQENRLVVVAVDWSPAPGVICPQDEPIATCAEKLEPQQKIYTITVDLTQRV